VIGRAKAAAARLTPAFERGEPRALGLALGVFKAMEARAAEVQVASIRLEQFHRQQRLPMAARNWLLWVAGYST
jgi:hypothetical protein